MKQRLGKLVFNRMIIRNKLNYIRKIFSILGFVPIEIENKFAGEITYIGYSDHFKVLQEGCMIPEYGLEVTVNMYNEINKVEVFLL